MSSLAPHPRLQESPVSAIERSDPYNVPAFSMSNRMLRATWGIVYAIFFRFSPRPLHAWRAFLLRCFGSANYGIFVTALTALIVFLVSLTGLAPGPIMIARGLNTLAGGAIEDRPIMMPLRRKATSSIGMTELIPVTCSDGMAEPLGRP